MYHVDITVGANTSKYWASVQFEDKSGTVHERTINREIQGTINGNHLEALIEAYKLLEKPCMVTVHTESDYIIAPFQQGWINNWEQNGWKSGKGKVVRNVERWKRLRQAMSPHSSRFLKLEGSRE